MLNFDDFDFAVKALTGGKNAVILDDIGMPSVMVALPKLDSHDLCGDLEPGTHPAWLRGSRELDTVYLSKFQNEMCIRDRCKEDCPIIPLCQSTNTLTAWKDLKGAYGHPATKYLFQDWYW